MPDKIPVCQSCAMPLERSEQQGTNLDGSPSHEYCKYCFQQGEFTCKLGLSEYIEKQTKFAAEKFGMEEAQARKIAESVLPQLKRWKNQ